MMLYRNYLFFLLKFLPLLSLYLIRLHESPANEAVLSMNVQTAQESEEVPYYRFYCELKLSLRKTRSHFISKKSNSRSWTTSMYPLSCRKILGNILCNF
jgi:hypothetical protein